jgi:hypothetical protein
MIVIKAVTKRMPNIFLYPSLFIESSSLKLESCIGLFQQVSLKAVRVGLLNRKRLISMSKKIKAPEGYSTPPGA